MPGGMGRKNGKKCRNKFCAVKEDGSVITNPAKQCSRFRRTANAGKQCPCFKQTANPDKTYSCFLRVTNAGRQCLCFNQTANPDKPYSRFLRVTNTCSQCFCFSQIANPDKQRPASAKRQMPAANAPVLNKQQTPVQRTGVCLLMLPFFYSCRCGICASSRRALTKSLSFITSCLSEPRRRTVTVPFSFSLAPTTAMTGILATECSRIL